MIIKIDRAQIKKWLTKIRKNLGTVFNIYPSTDINGTIVDISKSIRIRGANTWILICSAVLASIGLDVNSTAVIIGAMLISPLMSPILGIGLGYGISDHNLLIQSLKNFSMAIVVTLLVSTLYFIITPMGQLTPELMARTKPTLLDVLVAVFGGIAGIVASSRKEVPNAIPGVAIAIALMPPLCTVGFGLATGNWAVFFGAAYLFFINSVFIAIATYIMVRYLRFPHRTYSDNKTKQRTKIAISIVAIIVMVPSAFIFYDVISETRRDANLDNFIKSIESERYDAIDWDLSISDTCKTLKIFIIGEQMKAREIDSLTSYFTDNIYDDIKIKFSQMNLSEEERSSFQEEVMSEVSRSVLKQVAATKEIIDIKGRQVDSLEKTIFDMHYKEAEIDDIIGVIDTYHPEISQIYFGKASDHTKLDTTEQYYTYNISTALIKFKKKTRNKTKEATKQKLQKFLQERIKSDTLLIIEM